MKKEEIPQDKDAYRGRDQLQKLMYYTDEDGSYKTTGSVGWESEIEATKLAWSEIEAKLAITKQLVSDRTLSPLAYYIESERMTVSLVASYIGKWQWQVKRHFKPSVFDKLPESVLQRYADVLQISIEKLKNYNLD